MRRLVLATALALLAFAVPLAGLGAHNALAAGKPQFGGFNPFVNPCNGEIVQGDVTVTAIYAMATNTNSAHYTVHIVVTGQLRGSFGNTYVESREGTAQFTAPSGSGSFIDDNGNLVTFTYFDVPFHDVIVGEGSAPNFSIGGFTRVFVIDGQAVATGSHTLSSNCLGP